MGDELIDMHNRIGAANRFPVNRYPENYLFFVPGRHKMSYIPSYSDGK